jgi:hypothetical protein
MRSPHSRSSTTRPRAIAVLCGVAALAVIGPACAPLTNRPDVVIGTASPTGIYFRQDDTTEARSHGGLGLGLAIVHHLVDLHGGSIRAESAGEGQGATFTVSLPTLAGAATPLLEPGASTAGRSTAVEHLPALKELRVLVVDDDDDALDLVTRVLGQHGARVTAVPSARAALRALEGDKPDVLSLRHRHAGGERLRPDRSDPAPPARARGNDSRVRADRVRGRGGHQSRLVGRLSGPPRQTRRTSRPRAGGRRPGAGRRHLVSSVGTAHSAAELFELLWESLADVLGTAATATLLRRAVKAAIAHTAWSEAVIVDRNGLDYEYRLPEAWKDPGNEEAVGALRVLAAELRVLLVELTGPVVVSRLGRLGPLRERGIDFGDGVPT